MSSVGYITKCIYNGSIGGEEIVKGGVYGRKECDGVKCCKWFESIGKRNKHILG